MSLVNLRPGYADTEFYSAFHISVWLLTFIFSILFLSDLIIKESKKAGLVIFIFLLISTLFLITNKKYLAYDNINPVDEFFTNFSYEMDNGTTIRNLSNPNDTIFVDGYDDLILWESHLKSSYRYTWYTSFMPREKLYSDARTEMFLKNPPDFYYGLCNGSLKKSSDKVSEFIKMNYIQVTVGDKRGCIRVLKTKIDKNFLEKLSKLDGKKYKITSSLDI